MTLARRMPKRGFTNAPFRTHYHIVNVQDLEARCEDGADVRSDRTQRDAGRGTGVIRHVSGAP